jgi:hypothetical protein
MAAVWTGNARSHGYLRCQRITMNIHAQPEDLGGAIHPALIKGTSPLKGDAIAGWHIESTSHPDSPIVPDF